MTSTWLQSVVSRAWRVWRVREYTWGPERWRALGRLLPQNVRERIFDPAFSDLLRAWLMASKGRRRFPFAVQAVGTYVGCFPIAIPRLFVHNGRLTRFGRVSLWAVGILATVTLVVANMARLYATYAP